MDYKKRYDIQMKLNDSLKREMDNLRLALGEITDERDDLLVKIQKLQSQFEVTEQYQCELKQEITKAKEIQQQYFDSIKETRAVGKSYKGQMKAFLKGTKRFFKRKVF